MIGQKKVRSLVDEWVAQHEGFFVVDVRVSSNNLIVVEVENYDVVKIDDCINLNRFIESQLDREIEDYDLEVGSAGIGQPFKVKEQYEKYLNKEVEYVTKEGKKKRGILVSTDETSFVVRETSKVKPEGAKRKIEVEQDVTYNKTEVKYIKYLIRFK